MTFARLSIVAAAATGALAWASSGTAAPSTPGAGTVHVVVAEAVEQPVTIERTYTGTTAAARAVDLRAQVTGYLVERRFTEGSSVATGDTLFVIDARPFQTVVDQRQAELQEQQAVLRYADAAQQRYAAAAKLGAAAQDRLDQAIELQIKTQAAIGVHQAELAQAQFNLEMTDIKAPFDGRVGRALVDVGALVEGNKTALASLVQLNPVYVYFSPPNADLPLIEAQQEKAPVQVTVTFPHMPSEALRGTLTFISNAADATTGTIAMRATIADPPKAVRPGQFVQVRLNLVDAFEALVVPADAVSAVQGQTYVMVVGDDNRIARRKVRLGQDGADQGRIVEDGLSRGERVVVSDTRALRAGEFVSTEPAPAR